MTPVLLGLIAYVVAQLSIGLFVSRGVANEADYLVAGRRLGPWLAVLSIFATWFGAETCIGAAGEVYGAGWIGATSDPFGYAGCLLLMGVVFAAPLWRRQLLTVADLFRQRFSPSVERLVASMMVPTSVLWAAAQVRGFGQVVAASSTLDVDTAIAAGAFVAIVYTTAGGLLADAVTDLVQGVALIAGLLVLAWLAIPDGLEVAASAPIVRANVHATHNLIDRLEAWMIPIVGSVWAQELGARVLACRSERLARNATIGAAFLYLLVGCIPLTLGLLGPALMPGLVEHEQFLPRLAQQHLPTWAYVVFAGALLSAVLSTVDSALLSAASLTSHNLLARMYPGASDRTRLHMARGGVIVFGVIAWQLAISADGVHQLVQSASSFGSAGLFVAGSFGLFTSWGGPKSASAALIVGAGTWVFGAHVMELSTPFLVSLGAALLAYLVVASTFERSTRSTAAVTPRVSRSTHA